MLKLNLQYFGYLMWKTDSFQKTDAGQDWRQEKGTTKDKMFGWHHQLYGHEFEQAPGGGEGQGSLACCSPWGHKGSDTTEWLSWNWQPDTVCIPYICASTRASEDRLFIQKVVSGLSDVAVYLQVSKLSWIERKMAATLFGSIPSSTVQEALQNFLKVCFAYPLFQCQSGSCLHQAHLQLPSRKSFSCPCVDL